MPHEAQPAIEHHSLSDPTTLRHHLVTTKHETSFKKILFNEHASNAAHIDCSLSFFFIWTSI
jgi:hypothetical protein